VAVPTIATVSPARGFTGGHGLVEITGTGFRTWTIPPATGRPTGGAAHPTVRVRFNTTPATDVMVISATRLLVRPPPSPLPSTTAPYSEGTVAIEVTNLDDNGAPIAGETVTSATAYRFQRVQLATESDLSRVCRALIRLFRTQVIANVSMSAHTDYDPTVGDELNRVGLAELPGLALLGPEISRNRIYSIHGLQTVPLSNGVSALRRSPYTVDLVFSVVGVTEQNQQALNLMALVLNFFNTNHVVTIAADPADPSRGDVSYEIAPMPEGEPRMDASPDNSNLRIFTAKFRVIGFDIDDLAGFPGSAEVSRTAQIVEDPDISLEPCLEIET
jgi:hypothetical protein